MSLLLLKRFRDDAECPFWVIFEHDELIYTGRSEHNHLSASYHDKAGQ